MGGRAADGAEVLLKGGGALKDMLPLSESCVGKK